jgi:hypothetical protein
MIANSMSEVAGRSGTFFLGNVEKCNLPALTPSDLTGRQTSVLGRSEKSGIYISDSWVGSRFLPYLFPYRRQFIPGEFSRLSNLGHSWIALLSRGVARCSDMQVRCCCHDIFSNEGACEYAACNAGMRFPADLGDWVTHMVEPTRWIIHPLLKPEKLSKGLLILIEVSDSVVESRSDDWFDICMVWEIWNALHWGYWYIDFPSFTPSDLTDILER